MAKYPFDGSERGYSCLAFIISLVLAILFFVYRVVAPAGGSWFGL